MVVTGPDSLADSLADDLWQHILSQLCLIDVSNCARVTKRLRNVSQSDSIWSTLYEKEFNVRCCPRVHQTYKDAFRERALQERVRLQRKRQASLLRLQSKVQVSAAGYHQAKITLAEERTKLKQYQEELQVLKRLRTTAHASQCWTPSAVSKGFESFLAQAPIETSWRLEQVQQLLMDSRLHCITLEKTMAKSKHDMETAQGNLRALQGK